MCGSSLVSTLYREIVGKAHRAVCCKETGACHEGLGLLCTQIQGIRLTSPRLVKGVVENDVPLSGLLNLDRSDADLLGAMVVPRAAGQIDVKPDAPKSPSTKLRGLAGDILVEHLHELLESPATSPLDGTRLVCLAE